MTRAKRICPTPGCPNLQPCPAHTPKPWAGSTRRQRLPKGWAKLRLFVLHRDPVCKACNEAPSQEADHILSGDDHRLTNLQGLCSPCHQAKTTSEATRARKGSG